MYGRSRENRFQPNCQWLISGKQSDGPDPSLLGFHSSFIYTISIYNSILRSCYFETV